MPKGFMVCRITQSVLSKTVILVLSIGMCGYITLNEAARPVKKSYPRQKTVVADSKLQQSTITSRAKDPIFNQLDTLVQSLQRAQTPADLDRLEKTILDIRHQILEDYLQQETTADSPEESLYLDHLDGVDNLLTMVQDIRTGQLPIITAMNEEPVSDDHSNDLSHEYPLSTPSSSSDALEAPHMTINIPPPADTTPGTGPAASSSQQTKKSTGLASKLTSKQSLTRLRNVLKLVQSTRSQLANAAGIKTPSATSPSGFVSSATSPNVSPSPAPFLGSASSASTGLPNVTGNSSPTAPSLSSPTAAAQPNAANNRTSTLSQNQVNQNQTSQKVGASTQGPTQPPTNPTSTGQSSSPVSNNAASAAPAPPPSPPPPPPDECRANNPDWLRKPDSQLINENSGLFKNRSPRKQRDILRKLRKYDGRRVAQLADHCKRKAEAMKKQQAAQNNSGQPPGLSPTCQEAQKIRQTKIGANGFVLTRQEMDTLQRCEDEKKQQASQQQNGSQPGCIPPDRLLDCVDAKIILDSKPRGPYTQLEVDKLRRCPQLSNGKI